MHFHIIDSQTTYRRLLAAEDEATRRAIFVEELVQPFSGLVRIFGSDGEAAFAQWGMSPGQFSGEQRAQTEAVFKGLEAANAWQRAAQALERGREAFAPFANRIPLDNIVFALLIADLSTGPTANEGYIGFGGIPGWIMTVYGSATEYNLARVEACTVHELHHNVLGAVQPRNIMTETTVADYLVLEGLAESFAAELYGAELIGPWVTNLPEDQVEIARRVIGENLAATGFNTIRAYIFGDAIVQKYMDMPPVGVPPYAGYALGYRVVQAYLRRTGKSVAEATFAPTGEIIEESGVFA